MRANKTLTSLILVAFAAVTACNDAEEAGADPADEGIEQALMQPQEMDPEMQELMIEMQTIQQELGQLQQEVMQDPELMAQFQQIQGQVMAAMEEEDPELYGQIDGLEAEMMAAQEAGDQERMQAVQMQAQGMQQAIQALQMAVFDRPDIREPIEAFEAAQRERMIEINPDAAALIDRADEIVARLEG